MGNNGMKWRRNGTAGLSLVELLVVLGIIGIISAVAIPTLARTGWFTANKSSLGARELFTLLRAAKVYATTHNVDTAVAYGIRVVSDSETGALVPVADSLVLARALTHDEINALRLDLEVAHPLQSVLAGDDPVFIPLRGREGVFRILPNDTCVLPDLFQVGRTSPSGPLVSSTGLSSIRLLDLSGDIAEYILPRTFDRDGDGDIEISEGDVLDYKFDSDWKSFPAHRFTTDGSLQIPETFQKQRFRIRVGMLPDKDPSERFFANLNETELVPQSFPAIHYLRQPNGNPVQTPWVVDVETGQPVDIATSLLLFRPMGRVKIES